DHPRVRVLEEAGRAAAAERPQVRKRELDAASTDDATAMGAEREHPIVADREDLVGLNVQLVPYLRDLAEERRHGLDAAVLRPQARARGNVPLDLRVERRHQRFGVAARERLVSGLDHRGVVHACLLAGGYRALFVTDAETV